MLLGMVYVLPPGPVTTETVRRSLYGGVPAALSVQIGAVGGDLLYALLLLAGVGSMLNDVFIRSGVGFVGVVLLLYLGAATLRSSGAGVPQPHTAATGDGTRANASLRQAVFAGFSMSLLNPIAAGFWITVGSAAIEVSMTWLAGFALGSLLASLLTGLVAGQLHRQGVARYARWVSFGCGCALIAFGVQLGWTLLRVI